MTMKEENSIILKIATLETIQEVGFGSPISFDLSSSL